MLKMRNVIRLGEITTHVIHTNGEGGEYSVSITDGDTKGLS